MDIAQTIEKIQSIRNDFTPMHTEHEHWYKHEETGKIVPSVTTVLSVLDKPWLAKWKVHEAVRYIVSGYSGILNAGDLESILEESMKVSERKVVQAQVVGTTVHNAIEEFIAEWIRYGVQPKSVMDFFDKNFVIDSATHLRYDNTQTQIIAALRSAQELFDRYKDAVPLASEIRVGDPVAGYAGTLDLVILVNGKVEIWDWKTSNQINEKDPGYPMQISIYKKAFESMIGIKVEKLCIIQLSKHEDKYAIYTVDTSYKSIQAFNALLKYYEIQRGILNHYSSKERRR
jgi:hypothetical protein